MAQSDNCNIKTTEKVVNLHKVGKFFYTLLRDKEERTFRNEVYKKLSSIITDGQQDCEVIRNSYNQINRKEWLNHVNAKSRKVSIATAKALLAYFLDCHCDESMHKTGDSSVHKLFLYAKEEFNKRVVKEGRDYDILHTICQMQGQNINNDWYDVYMRKADACMRGNSIGFVRSIADDTKVDSIIPSKNNRVNAYIKFKTYIEIASVKFFLKRNGLIESGLGIVNYDQNLVIGLSNGTFEVRFPNNNYTNLYAEFFDKNTSKIGETDISISQSDDFLNVLFLDHVPDKTLSLQEMLNRQGQGEVTFEIKGDSKTSIKDYRLEMLDINKNVIADVSKTGLTININPNALKGKSNFRIQSTKRILQPNEAYIRFTIENQTNAQVLDIKIFRQNSVYISIKDPDTNKEYECLPLDCNGIMSKERKISIELNRPLSIKPNKNYIKYYNQDILLTKNNLEVGVAKQITSIHPQVIQLPNDCSHIEFELTEEITNKVYTKKISVCADRLPCNDEPVEQIPGVYAINAHYIEKEILDSLFQEGLRKQPCDIRLMGNANGLDIIANLPVQCGDIKGFSDGFYSGACESKDISKVVTIIFDKIQQNLPERADGEKIKIASNLVSLSGHIVGTTDGQPVRRVWYNKVPSDISTLEYISYSQAKILAFNNPNPTFSQLWTDKLRCDVTPLVPSCSQFKAVPLSKDIYHNEQLGAVRAYVISRIISGFKNTNKPLEQILLISKEYPELGGNYRGIWLKLRLTIKTD
jgi:hypothetical protein